MITYTKEFRNFSAVWKDNEGRFNSKCYVARYTLTDKEYAETSEYLIVDDQIGGKGISYDLSNTSAKSPVSIDGGCIRFLIDLLNAIQAFGTRFICSLDHLEKQVLDDLVADCGNPHFLPCRTSSQIIRAPVNVFPDPGGP